MRVTIRKWGNSAALRLPMAVMSDTGLHLDDEVDVREEQGHVIIEPVAPKRYSLDDLLSRITDENSHGEVDSGPAVGLELL